MVLRFARISRSVLPRPSCAEFSILQVRTSWKDFWLHDWTLREPQEQGHLRYTVHKMLKALLIHFTSFSTCKLVVSFVHTTIARPEAASSSIDYIFRLSEGTAGNTLAFGFANMYHPGYLHFRSPAIITMFVEPAVLPYISDTERRPHSTLFSSNFIAQSNLGLPRLGYHVLPHTIVSRNVLLLSMSFQLCFSVKSPEH